MRIPFLVIATALGLGFTIGIEKLFGPFGSPYDGLFGIAVGVVVVAAWGLALAEDGF